MICTEREHEIFTDLNTYGFRIGLRNVKELFCKLEKTQNVYFYLLCAFFCLLLVIYYSKIDISTPHGKTLCVRACVFGGVGFVI